LNTNKDTSQLLSVGTAPIEQNVRTFTFIKEEGYWYIFLTHYLEQGWNKRDLEITDGAAKLLNIISKGKKKLTLEMCTHPFEGSDYLELMEVCENSKRGGIYLLDMCEGKEVNSFIRIWDMAIFAFGCIPEHIYFKRCHHSTKKGL
jgi:hypothetical protein